MSNFEDELKQDIIRQLDSECCHSLASVLMKDKAAELVVEFRLDQDGRAHLKRVRIF